MAFCLHFAVGDLDDFIHYRKSYNVLYAFRPCIVLTVTVVLCSFGVLCMPISAIFSRWGGLEWLCQCRRWQLLVDAQV